MGARVESLLIVEDSPELLRALAEASKDWTVSVHLASTIAAARNVLARVRPEVVLLDVCLPDGDALSLVEDLRALQPLPIVIAISGAATPTQTFRLAQAGVRGFLAKPLDLARLESVWDEALKEPPQLGAQVRASIGRVPLQQLEGWLRKTAVTEALARSHGSVRGAARLLRISRQLLQHILHGER
jgi:DNA-binding NtrC family response regulator